MTIKQISSGGGEFTLDAPASASNRTITLPDATTTLVGTDAAQTLTNKTITSGTVYPSGTPCFRAYATATTNITSGQIISLSGETFDVGNNFASSQFTAPVAGYYQFNGAFQATGGTGNYQIYLAKNGSAHSFGTVGPNSVSDITVSDVIYLAANDTVALYGVSTSGTGVVLAGSSVTYLSGVLVRVA